MDNRLEQDALIEDALKSQPLALMPRSITLDVMSRIQTDKRPQLVNWNDFGFSLVIASCIASLWFAFVNLPPIALAKLRIQGILLYQDFLVNADWLIPSLFFGMSSVLIVFVIGYLLKNLKTNG